MASSSPVSITDIILALNPLCENSLRKLENNQGETIDHQICHLAKVINECQFGDQSAITNGFKLVNTHLSSRLTLLDLKTAYAYSEGLGNRIVSYLRLKKNIKKLDEKCSLPNRKFALLERIKTASEELLQLVSLEDLQLTGFAFPADRTSVWFALADTEQFLSRQVCDFNIESHRILELTAERIKCLLKESPRLISDRQSETYTYPWFFGLFGKFSLSIGKMLTLSGAELNKLAEWIPPDACSLFSDEQIQTVQFHRFSREQLNEMIGSGDKEETRRRLSLLSPSQKEHLHKDLCRPCILNQLSDEFFATLRLSQLEPVQVIALFPPHYLLSVENNAPHHLKLVPPQEIVRGLHLLTSDHWPMLSNAQVAALDPFYMFPEQVKGIYTHTSHSQEKSRERVQLIPVDSINHAIEKYNDIVLYLSKDQLQHVNVDLLDPRIIRSLFPGFTIASVFPDHKHSKIESPSGEVLHRFERHSNESSSVTEASIYDLKKICQDNRENCLARAREFSPEQLLRMKDKMLPEVQELLFPTPPA